MSFDYRKLVGKIKEVCGTQNDFAKKIGIGRVSLSHRLNNKLEFSQNEINRSVEVLGLKKEEIPLYFFSEKVQKEEQVLKGA